MTQNDSNDLALAQTNASLTRLNQSLERSSLDDLVRARTRQSILLVDVSGSMSGAIRSGGTRIEAMRRVVTELRETHPVPVAGFGFNETDWATGKPAPVVRLVDDVDKLDAEGGTPMDKGIRFCKRQGATHIVLVTDGMPDSADGAMTAAREFGGPIDTFFIGNPGERGAKFCAQISRATNGTANQTDLGETKLLASKIKGLLGEGQKQIAG